MAINPAELTPDQRFRVIEGSLAVSEVRADNTCTTSIELLAALLPSGFNDKGAPSPPNARALAAMFTTLMETRTAYARQLSGAPSFVNTAPSSEARSAIKTPFSPFTPAGPWS